MKDAVLHEDDHTQEHVDSKQGDGNANATNRIETIVEHENDKRHLNGGASFSCESVVDFALVDFPS